MENNVRLATIETRISDIDQELAANFPDYAAFETRYPYRLTKLKLN